MPLREQISGLIARLRPKPQPKRSIALIAAVDRNRAIGVDGGLPWYLPADLEHFRTMTEGHPIIMGARTWESIGRPLRGRTNIVLSHRHSSLFPGADLVVGSLDRAIAEALKLDEHPFIMGGGQVFEQAIQRQDVDTIYLTVVETYTLKVDTYFPPISLDQWSFIEREPHGADQRNFCAYEFRTYWRR